MVTEMYCNNYLYYIILGDDFKNHKALNVNDLAKTIRSKSRQIGVIITTKWGKFHDKLGRLSRQNGESPTNF